ncbi:hypothetical protein LCGC14_0694270 [marine sediment metagenome]|uniref:MYM-type domain-containing protein n=1 Tax=marine sediment metagenome TaxID=412755 RepID=A0A0F9QJR5_9ZZZZ
MFPYCSHCNKELDKKLLMLVDSTIGDELSVGYFCSFLCLRSWIDEHR